MTIYVDPRNATITQWSLNNEENHILFPEQSVVIGEERKLRGGAFVCSPIFGNMPNTPDYEGVTLARHGLVRGYTDSAHHQASPSGVQSYEFTFHQPWRHTTRVVIDEANHGKVVTHRIIVANQGKVPMPLSLGFHPYFATFGMECVVMYDGQHLPSSTLKERQSIYISRRGYNILSLRTAHRTIAMVLDDQYDGFNIWTDDRWRYICVEPIMGGHGKYRMLEPEARIECVCIMSVRD